MKLRTTVAVLALVVIPVAGCAGPHSQRSELTTGPRPSDSSTGTAEAVTPGAKMNADADLLRKAVTFYASFDSKAEGDFGRGDLRFWTRADDPAEKGKKVVRFGFDEDRIQVVADGGISGGAIDFRSISSDNAFVFFPADGKLAVRDGGWGGAVSLWVKADLAKIPEAGPWDPFLLVEKGWNDGAVWCDFAPGAAPRDFRIGLFPALKKGVAPPTLDEGEKIWLRVKSPPFETGAWRHIVQVWDNFDTGKSDAWTACYVDGKLAGKIEGRDGKMDWDAERVRFHLGSGLVGMIDEVALFDRPITEGEVARLNREPGVIGKLLTSSAASD